MRKVLSFVLVLTLVLSSFSMAFAATPAQAGLSDIAGNANAEAITVNFNLGIIDGMGDGTFAPDAAVTRAQFAAMMTRALAVPDSALAGYTSTSFKDTTGYGWAVPYLAFCQSKGIMIGDGNGNAMPGKTVSVNEAMAMVLRAIGYTNNSAALVGVWPANYVSLAQNNALYDDVATAVGVTRANAAQIIYNALTVDKVEVSADGTTKTLTGKSMLTTGLDCTSEENVVISGDEDSLINLKAFIGQKVTVYYNSDDEIIAIAGVASDALVGEIAVDGQIVETNATTGAMAISPAGVIFNGDDDVDYTFKGTPEFFNYYVNGQLESAADAPFAITSDDSITINGDISGKTIKGISSVTRWVVDNAKKVGTADINQIKDGSLLTADFSTLKDGSIDTNSFDLVGVKSLNDIKADNVVYVYEKGQTGDIVKVEVGTSVIEGKVTTTKSSGTKIIVNGTTYEKAGVTGATALTSIKAGDEVKLYLDVNGDVFKFDVTSGKTDKYAVVMDNDTKYDKVKLYTSDDDSAWYEYTSDVNAAAVTTDAATGIQNLSLVAYSLDKDGKVDNATNGGVNVATNATVSGLTLKTDAPASYKINSDAIVYGVTGGAIETVTTIGNVDTLTALGDIAFVLDGDGNVAAILVNNDFTSKTNTDSYAVISEVNSTENADADSVQQVIGFMDGAALDKLTNDDNTADGVDTVAAGLYKVAFDADGAIKTVTAQTTANGADGLANLTTPGGYVVNDIDGNNIQLTGGGVTSDWQAIDKDAKVYRAIYKDGELDSYKLSDMSAINKGYFAMLYNTVNEDDSNGYDVVVYITDKDL
jgi:hypothetical protein